ncbi:MAG: hypothetical protein QXI16_01950, partial [Sulfolobaceae archaeon]
MKAKILISVILIISILLASLVIMPVQTVSASAQSDMDRFINNFGLQSYSGSVPALIWYLIYYLGSMGFGIFTVGQLADAMNDPDIKPLINDWIIRTLPGGSEHLLLQQISESGGGAITVNANQWAVDRSAISAMFRNGKLEDMRASYAWNSEPKSIIFGNEQYKAIVIENTTIDNTTFPFLNTSSINYLKSISIRNNVYGNYTEEFQYNDYIYRSLAKGYSVSGSNYAARMHLYRRPVDGVYPTGSLTSMIFSDLYRTSDAYIYLGGGIIPVLTLITSDGLINSEGAKYKLKIIFWGAFRPNSTTDTEFKYTTMDIDYSVTSSDMAGYSEPAITDKLLRDITPNIQYIQPTDTVTITPDAR